jgi:hypothetical protein
MTSRPASAYGSTALCTGVVFSNPRSWSASRSAGSVIKVSNGRGAGSNGADSRSVAVEPPRDARPPRDPDGPWPRE